MTDAQRDGPDDKGGPPASGNRLARQCFLAMLSKTGNTAKACESSGMTRRQVMTLRERDRAFDRAYDDAMNDAADLLEAEAWRRALEGTPQAVRKAGKRAKDAAAEPVGARRYSDPLLMMLLRGCRPEKFRMHGRTSMPADPMIGIREIMADNDPSRVEDDQP